MRAEATSLRGPSVDFCRDGHQLTTWLAVSLVLSPLSHHATGVQRALTVPDGLRWRSAHREPDAGRSRGTPVPPTATPRLLAQLAGAARRSARVRERPSAGDRHGGCTSGLAPTPGAPPGSPLCPHVPGGLTG